MTAPREFLADVTEIRRRARQHLADGAVTKNYGGKAIRMRCYPRA